jgi:hypothetical protein
MILLTNFVSRAPLKNKLNKRVILARRTNGTLAFASKAQANTTGNTQRAFFCQHFITLVL